MSSEIVIGGASLLVMFDITANAFGTKKLTMDLTTQTQIVPDAARIWTITPTSEKDDGELDAFLDEVFAPGAAIVAIPQRTYEEGEVVGGGVVGGKVYGALVYGGKQANPRTGAIGTKRKNWAGLVTVDPTSGGYTQSNGAITNPAFVLKSVAAPADTSIGTGLWDTGKVDTPGAAIIIPAGSTGKIVRLDLPS